MDAKQNKIIYPVDSVKRQRQKTEKKTVDKKLVQREKKPQEKTVKKEEEGNHREDRIQYKYVESSENNEKRCV